MILLQTFFPANWLLRNVPALAGYHVTGLSPELCRVADTKFRARKKFSLPALHLVWMVVNAASCRLKPELNLLP